MRSIFTLLIIATFSIGGIAQVDRTLVVEHYTNTLCGSCAAQNGALFELLDDYPDVLHISYHPSSPYSNCAFNLHNVTENDDRTNYYGIYGATPRVVLQGDVVGFQNPILNAGDIEAELGKKSDYMVSVSQEQLNASTVNVQVVVKLVGQPNTQSHNLYAVIAEKEINYNAPNGEDLHHNVFRKVLLNQAINIGSSGDSVIINTSYEIHGDWEEEEMFVTAMVQDDNTKAVLQAFESDKLDAGSSFISDNEILSLDGVLYPNPATDVIHLGHTQATFLKAEFYAVTGNLVKSFPDPSSMNVSDLPEGIYMVVLTDDSQQKHISRIIKR
jgi:hypothetical protein